ncbi:MAG: PIN domain-containing protein [Nitrospirae bacterium]|nr:PIN domain-containing protein [Nitrospirota bacterium]
MKEDIFADTSALYAFINAKDPDHKRVKSFLSSFKGKIFITNYIFDEIVTLVSARVGHEKAVYVGNILQKSPQIEKVWISPIDEKQAWELFVSRNDKSYSFTDCTSFIVMKRLRITKSLALDEHFKQEGFKEIL